MSRGARCRGPSELLTIRTPSTAVFALSTAFSCSPDSCRIYIALNSVDRDRIEAFAVAQRNSIVNVETEIPGGKAGHTIAPVAVAGCYAPGGRYPLPSSVLMTAVTARAAGEQGAERQFLARKHGLTRLLPAGVKKVWAASPRPSPVTLGAAYVANVDAFLAIGGAQVRWCARSTSQNSWESAESFVWVFGRRAGDRYDGVRCWGRRLL